MSLPPNQALVPKRSRPDGLLARYIAEVRRCERLDREEEIACAKRFAEGDQEAGRRLIQANLHIVLRMAFEYDQKLHDVLELIQEGNLGLMRALEKFDPTRDIAFSTYARHWIRAMILKFLVENHRMVKLGTTNASRKLFFGGNKVRNAIEQRGNEATDSKVAEELGISLEEYMAVKVQLAIPVHLDGERPDGRPWAETLAAAHAMSPETAAVESDLRHQIRACGEAFGATLASERDQAMWNERLYTDEEPVSLAELGRRYDVSRERMRQLEKRLKARARLFIEAELTEADSYLAA